MQKAFKGFGIDVSPVYAGIDPLLQEMEEIVTCFPRVCGDRPDEYMVEPEVFEVSPVYAGIDQLFIVGNPDILCFPRVCGDRPD